MVVSVSNKAAESVQRAPEPVPRLDPAAALLFVINDSAGAVEVDAKCAVIEAALAEQGRKGELLVCGTDELSRVAAKAAATALERNTAVVAVGGDGSLNAVAQFVRISHVIGFARSGGDTLQAFLRCPLQRWIIDPTQLARGKNDRCRAGVLDQQALSHRPDEDKQPHDGEQKRPQQTQYCTVHGWIAFALLCARWGTNSWVYCNIPTKQ